MEENLTIQILVLDGGFVFVGRCPDVSGCGLWVHMKDVRGIRQWGTSNGLGELAGGPLSATILDDLVFSVKLPVRSLLFTVDEVDQESWEPHLKHSFAAATRRSGRKSSRTGSKKTAETV